MDLINKVITITSVIKNPINKRSSIWGAPMAKNISSIALIIRRNNGLY